MSRIIDVICRLFPHGTSPLHPDSWKEPPFWPPDAFAISATLINRSGCYAEARYSTPGSPGCIFTGEFCRSIQDKGSEWARHPFPNHRLPDIVHKVWRKIFQCREERLRESKKWQDAAIALMLLADEASAGVGFYDPQDPTAMNYLIYKEQANAYAMLFEGKRYVTIMPGRVSDIWSSLTWMAHSDEVIVQPKSRTPQVGCTLRSLSHHLCLLPQIGEVKTRWLFAPLKELAEEPLSLEEPLNLLLVPFPFQLDSNSFVPAKNVPSASGRFFEIQQDWLRDKTKALRPDDIAEFLIGLINSAQKETRRVHGLVLPEAALSREHVERVAQILSRQDGLELFVSGIVHWAGDGSGHLPENKVASFIFANKSIYTQWDQCKHHRWKLDGSQIRRYHLGDALDYRYPWWERIGLCPRELFFYVFRHGASLATLICEDLARVDPVQTVLRAVGPNLVIVLLMDGPQLERRWPGRYATVLADDPGSAVLTLTSLGMVRRSRMPGEKERREVALWKEPGGEARELSLPDGCHALLVTLSPSLETNYTLDDRSDNEGTVHLSLTGVRGVAHPNPRSWVDDNRRIW